MAYSAVDSSASVFTSLPYGDYFIDLHGFNSWSLNLCHIWLSLAGVHFWLRTCLQTALSLSLMLWPTISRPVCLGIKHPSGAYDQIFITVRQLQVCWCGVLSLMRGRVCRLQLLLALASAVILWSLPLWTRDHILLSQIWDFPFRRFLRLAGSRWRYSTLPPHRSADCRAEQSSSILPATSQHGHSWHRAPLGPMAIYLFSVKTFVFFSFFHCSSFDKREGVGLFFFIIGVPLLHLIPPEVTLK
jgi:hypothetical protein